MENTHKDVEKKYLMTTYNRAPIAMRKGEGNYVIDSEGTKYLDLVAGIAVCITGYCHPHVVEAIRAQAGEIIHCSNLYHIPQQLELAKRLSALSGGKKAFFCNSGAEANEAATKLARKYTKLKAGRVKGEIITLKNSFHGRTMETLAATGQPKYQKDFEPMPAGFSYADMNDIGSVEEKITEKTSAVMIELIQGEGGIVVADKKFVKALRKLCDEKEVLLVIDEIQTGMGRTGTFFCYEQYGIDPDIVTLAKGLASGVPIGAMLAKPEIADVFQPGDHGSTFGGNPLACAAAIATLDVIRDGELAKRAAEVGAYFMKCLGALKEKHSIIKEIRGKGLMIGAELALDAENCKKIQSALMTENHILVNVTAGNVLRFVPPLTITKENIDEALAALDAALARCE